MHNFLELKIDDLSVHGTGVGKCDDGTVVFVPYTTPGDTVTVHITRREKRYWLGELVQVISPSTDRLSPRCPVFGQCGGCDLQHVPYPIQWQLKLKKIRESLRRAGVAFPDSVSTFPAERLWNYRNRVQLKTDGRLFGFYQRGSRQIVDVTECAIAHPAINAKITELRQIRAGGVGRVEIDVDAGGSVSTRWNSPPWKREFRQVHEEQNQVLCDFVTAHVGPGRVVLDLYGGRGNLSEKLEKTALKIYCVDTVDRADRPDRPKTKFINQAVDQWISHPQSQAQIAACKAEVAAILDPPRAGMGPQNMVIATALRGLAVSRIVAIGCDPVSWARDLKVLTSQGFTVVQIGALDLFPQTRQVEALAVLQAKELTDA